METQKTLPTALELVAAERKRQIEHERWDYLNDDRHRNGELASAAACYLLPAYRRKCIPVSQTKEVPVQWTFDSDWWKPTPNDRIRELVKGAALAIAEIERLQRAEKRKQERNYLEELRKRIYTGGRRATAGDWMVRRTGEDYGSPHVYLYADDGWAVGSSSAIGLTEHDSKILAEYYGRGAEAEQVPVETVRIEQPKWFGEVPTQQLCANGKVLVRVSNNCETWEEGFLIAVVEGDRPFVTFDRGTLDASVNLWRYALVPRGTIGSLFGLPMVATEMEPTEPIVLKPWLKEPTTTPDLAGDRLCMGFPGDAPDEAEWLTYNPLSPAGQRWWYFKNEPVPNENTKCFVAVGGYCGIAEGLPELVGDWKQAKYPRPRCPEIKMVKQTVSVVAKVGVPDENGDVLAAVPSYDGKPIEFKHEPKSFGEAMGLGNATVGAAHYQRISPEIAAKLTGDGPEGATIVPEGISESVTGCNSHSLPTLEQLKAAGGNLKVLYHPATGYWQEGLLVAISIEDNVANNYHIKDVGWVEPKQVRNFYGGIPECICCGGKPKTGYWVCDECIATGASVKAPNDWKTTRIWKLGHERTMPELSGPADIVQRLTNPKRDPVTIEQWELDGFQRYEKQLEAMSAMLQDVDPIGSVKAIGYLECAFSLANLVEQVVKNFDPNKRMTREQYEEADRIYRRFVNAREKIVGVDPAAQQQAK